MADERAEAPSLLGFGRARGNLAPGVVGRATDWVTSQFGNGRRRGGRDYRLPIIISGVWLMALGAYAIGYFERLAADAAAGTARVLPTLDLLFFAFAAVGPVLMLWMVVLLQVRAERLSDALSAQSESALALATTIAGLHEAVETLRDGTTVRIAEAADAVERDGAAAMARLDTALAEMAERLDSGMMEAVLVLDRNLRDRSAKADASLGAQRDALARRLEDDAERLYRAIEAQARGLEAAQEMLGERIADSLAAYGNRFERGTTALLESLGEQLGEIGDSVDAALTALAADLASAQRNRHRDLDADMREREARLHAAVDEVAHAIEGGVAPLLGEIRTALSDTSRTIAAHPPATTDQLARLLGETARREVSPERRALTDAVGRLGELEKQAQKLIERIDRTARLNPLMEAPEGGAGPAIETSVAPELPFPALPSEAGRSELNWTAVVHALDGRQVDGAAGRLVRRAATDPDVATVATLAERLAAALAEDGLHLADIAPVHAPAELWRRFGMGERGEAFDALGQIGDEIPRAIARARMRGDPEVHALALRLVEAYARLVGRAAEEVGPDPILVELADTPPGRGFVLFAGLTRAFRATPVVAEV